ncbi:hypothetical protein KEM48_000923, partial [Puccinia striiformis f. sp. tritici PST-130]
MLNVLCRDPVGRILNGDRNQSYEEDELAQSASYPTNPTCATPSAPNDAAEWMFSSASLGPPVYRLPSQEAGSSNFRGRRAGRVGIKSMHTSPARVPPPLEDGEISEGEPGLPPMKAPSQTYSIQSNTLIDSQAENEPRVYASARARKVMARVKKLAPSRSQQSRPRPVDTSRANEDRSRGESREFPRGSQSRRWHPTKRLGEARPAPPARQKTKPRRTFPDDEQENVNHNQNLDQHSNRDFTDYHHHQRPPHHHRHNQPGIDRQSNYAQDDQYKPRDDQYERRDDQYEHRDDQYEND